MSGSSHEKAWFTNLDTLQVLHVQYNPSALQLDDRAVWGASEVLEHTSPVLDYQRGVPSTLGMELIFDSTDSEDNVHDKYVRPLRAFLTSTVVVFAGADPAVAGKRPPFCAFTWGSLQFEGVVEVLSTTYLMFRSDGTPLRARVSLRLKQAPRRGRPTAEGPLAVGRARAVVTRAGETLSHVAARTGVDARAIARANHLDDPLDLPAGTELVIPADAERAEVLGQQARRQAPRRWHAVVGDDPLGLAPTDDPASFSAPPPGRDRR